VCDRQGVCVCVCMYVCVCVCVCVYTNNSTAYIGQSFGWVFSWVGKTQKKEHICNQNTYARARTLTQSHANTHSRKHIFANTHARAQTLDAVTASMPATWDYVRVIKVLFFRFFLFYMYISMYVYVCVCTYVCILHVHLCVYACVCLCKQILVYVCTCVGWHVGSYTATRSSPGWHRIARKPYSSAWTSRSSLRWCVAMEPTMSARWSRYAWADMCWLLCICMHMYTYIHTHICMCVCIPFYVCVFVFVYFPLCVDVYLHVCMYVYVYIFVYIWYMCV